MDLFSKAYYKIWNIGFIEKSISDVILSDNIYEKVRWVIHNYKDRFFADPFILSIDDNTIKVLVEDFPYYNKKGVISVLYIERKTYRLINKKVVLRQPFHMSYPFIIRKEDGSIWVAPESSSCGALYIYKMDPTTLMLEDRKVIISEPLVDSTIIDYRGLNWLFCTKKGEDSNRKLYIYYAENPEGPYTEHPGNPVVVDDTMARPAGSMFKDGETLYRVIQKCDKAYGEYINVSRIDTLSTTEFKESFVKELRAEDSIYSNAFHTINGYGDICVVDGLRVKFAPLRRLWYEIRNKFGL